MLARCRSMYLCALVLGACGGSSDVSQRDAATSIDASSAGDVMATLDGMVVHDSTRGLDAAEGRDVAVHPNDTRVDNSMGDANIASLSGPSCIDIAWQIDRTQSREAWDIELIDVDRDGIPEIFSYGWEGVSVVHAGRRTTLLDASVTDGSIATADVDGDTDLDLIVLSQNIYAVDDSDGLFWFENNSTTPAQWPRRLLADVNGHSGAIVTADVDGDGDSDIVGSLEDTLHHEVLGRLVWWENTGSAWTERTISSSFTVLFPRTTSQALAIGDIDGDADPDLIAAKRIWDGPSDAVEWWEFLRTTRTWSLTTLDEGGDMPIAVHIADLEGDGQNEIIVGEQGRDNFHDDVFYLLKRSAGTWNRHRLLTRSKPAAIATADVDRDGDLDLLLGREYEGSAWWWPNNGNGTAAAPPTWSYGREIVSVQPISYSTGRHTSVIRVADMDQDGVVDIVYGGDAGDSGVEIRVARHIAVHDGRQYAETGVINASINEGTAQVADLDADGDQDVVGFSTPIGGNVNAQELVWYERIRPGLPLARRVITSGIDQGRAVRVSDIDGDRDLDVLVSTLTLTGGLVMWFENSGTQPLMWHPHSISTDTGAVSIELIDVDNNQRVDVVGTSPLASSIFYWDFTGSPQGTWTRHIIDGSYPLAVFLGAADFDADGEVDVFATSGQANAAAAWWKRSGTTFTKRNITVGLSSPIFVVAHDVDGNGRLDLIESNATTLAVYLCSQDGLQGCSASLRQTVAVRHISLLDVDSDGDLDILTSGTSGSLWFEPVAPTSETWIRHTVGPAGFAAFVTDFDQNSSRDFVTVMSNGLAWWSGTCR